jgi:hypothetical protein
MRNLRLIGRSAKLVMPAALSSSLWAQAVTLRGVVADPSGAVVPKATVTVKGPAGFSRTTMTADDGSYTLSGMPEGTLSRPVRPN